MAFEDRFTEKAKSVFEEAQAVAAELGHVYIGSEHILFALAGTDGEKAVLSAGETKIPLFALTRASAPDAVPTVPAALLGREGLTLSFRLKNESAVSGGAVPMLFLRRHRGSAVPRVRELGDFARVSLAPGEEKEVRLTLTPEVLAFLTRDMKKKIEPGLLELLLWEGNRMLLRTAVRVC